MTKSAYPQPGDLLRLVTKPVASNALTERQERTILSLISQIGLPEYRKYKRLLVIPVDTGLTRLSKGQAWHLINAIINDINDLQK